MFTLYQIKKFQDTILRWYKNNGRHDLPWRHTDDLYHITVSEIMLQQTNVPKVIDKYNIFLKRFPSWEHLARARQASVVRQWQGLGYNRRALYLHKMAKIVVKDFDGKLPEDPEILESFPGMGPYTRNAVLIFGRNKDFAARDVNVDRVIRRLHGKKTWSEKSAEIQAQNFLPEARSCDWHSALMDFASFICTKRSPQCEVCPLKKTCKSYPDPQDFAVKKKKEPGRTESGKHIPRRIYRGRVVEMLRDGAQGIDKIGREIKNDWNNVEDLPWLEDLLQRLKKDGMIIEKQGSKQSVWKLK